MAGVHLSTFIEGVVVHGKEMPRVLVVPCPHPPNRGQNMPAQIPWAPGFLPPALLTAQLDQAWGIPFRTVDKSGLPVVFDERNSRLPQPWMLRIESSEGAQRLYLTYLLRSKSAEDQPPEPPMGGEWLDAAGVEHADLLPGMKRLLQAALTAAKD
jgi:hypothetical protein